jgi:hypothetical protein
VQQITELATLNKAALAQKDDFVCQVSRLSHVMGDPNDCLAQPGEYLL